MEEWLFNVNAAEGTMAGIIVTQIFALIKLIFTNKKLKNGIKKKEEDL